MFRDTADKNRRYRNGDGGEIARFFACVQRKATALATLVRQRRLTPSCAELALLRREQWAGKADRRELDTQTRN